MLGVSLFSFLSPAFSQQVSPSPPTVPNPAVKLSDVLSRAPFEKRAALEELCNWLVCCKNLWPASAEMHADAAPFSLHACNQSPRIDPHCVEKTVYGVLGTSDPALLEEINHYVLASDDRHWQTLRTQDYPAASIDPTDVPRNWPRGCLELAMRTMDMRGADLFLANLSALDLRDVVLSKADLQYACLDMAKAQGLDLSHANVKEATFQDTDLSDSNLTGLTFSTRKNNLKDVILNEAILDDIGLDIGPYEAGPDGAYALRKGLLPVALDLLIRRNMNDLIEQDCDSRVARYLFRILPHIAISPGFCRECLELTLPEDQPVVLETLMRHASLRYKASATDLASIYDAVTAYVEHQFLEGIDKQSHDDLQRALGEICQRNLDYLECIPPDDPAHEDLLNDSMNSTETCLQLTDNEARECLKDIALALLDTAKTTPSGFDAIRRAVRHLSLSNATPVFRTLMHDMTPEQCNQLIQGDLNLAAAQTDLPQLEESAPPHTDAADKDASGSTGTQEENSRRLIDLIHDSLPPDMRAKLHTLLQNVSDKRERTVYKGDWDALSSYTAADTDHAHNAHADINIISAQASAEQDATTSDKAEAASWQTALCSSLLLFPTSYFPRI